MSLNFAVVGAGGFVAPRHLDAIRDTGNRVVAALDPNDSVGVLDRYSFDIDFFTEPERFDRHLEKLRRGPEAERVHYVSVCSPNHLHDAHCRLGLRVGANVICEKPIVLNPWNLEQLAALEAESSGRISTILQLRVHPVIVALKESLSTQGNGGAHDVSLTYVVGRGNWYHNSWKGQPDRSGGVATNIGIHFFDMLIWLFGSVVEARLHLSDDRRTGGFLELERARVRWFLSVDPGDLPESAKKLGQTSHRSIRVDGQEIEFSTGFANLHTRVYENILAGNGFGLDVARPSIELMHRLRAESVCDSHTDRHEFIAGRR